MSARRQTVGQDGDEGEQAQKNGAGASDGQVGPLPLGLETDVSADLLESHFDLPALDEPGQNLIGSLLWIGAEQREGIKAGQRVTDENPANGEWLEPSVVPDGGPGNVLHGTSHGAIPVSDGQLGPQGFLRLEAFLQLGQAFSDKAGTTGPFGSAGRWRIEQTGIGAESGDTSDRAAERLQASQKFQGREGLIGQ